MSMFAIVIDNLGLNVRYYSEAHVRWSNRINQTSVHLGSLKSKNSPKVYFENKHSEISCLQV